MSEPITVVTWKWSKKGYRSSFGPATVNTLKSMLRRNLKIDHELVCVTDDPDGIDHDIRVVDIRTLPSYRWINVPNPSNPRNPGCYVRLFMFSEQAASIFGKRILSTDLDVVFTGDLTSMLDRSEDFVIWGGQALGPGRLGAYNWYNGSFILLRAGSRTEVFEDFNPIISPAKATRAKCRGSDQGWIAYRLGRKEAVFGEHDGIRSFRNHIIPAGGKLIDGTRVVAFHGRHDPWHLDVQANYPWVKEHYR
jgi:hypothetical protein